MTDKEAMQMALDTVQDARDYLDIVNTQAAESKSRRLTKTLEALRTALAQVDQEPVVWMDVKDYENQYEVSSNGDIRNKKTGTILSKSLMGAGYVKADLWKDGVRWQTSAHRIVASAFVANPEMLDEVNHINGDKTDNRVCNLEWVSRSDNVKHSYYELGNQVKPVIATHIERGEKFHYPSISAAERDGFSSANIINVINGKRKQHKGFTFSYADTAPPQREFQDPKTWIDLSSTEIKILKNASINHKEFADLLIAKFKEKNENRQS